MEEIKVRGDDIAFYCIKKKGHKGKHQISIDEEVLLFQSIMDSRLRGEIYGNDKHIKRLKKARKVIDK